MPELDPVFYDAIDEVIEQREQNAEWDGDEMRSALIEVAKGESQGDAAEGRDFSQPAVSRAFSAVEEAKRDLKRRGSEGSTLFRDPTEEAVDGFEDFMEEMDEKYDMGIRGTAIQMMVDEIRDSEQLPSPMYLGRFLKGAKSGVQGADVDYIQKRYKNWLDRFKDEVLDQSGGMSGMGSPSGASVGGQNSPQGRVDGGVSIMPDQGGQQQPQQGHRQQGGNQPNDRVSRLEREIQELKDAVTGGGDRQTESAMIEIEQEDGRVVTLPADHPAARQMLDSGSGENEMLKTLRQAKELGLIPDPNAQQQGPSEGERLAEEIGGAIESMGEKQAQAQQQMSANFNQALQQMQEMVTEDEDDDMSPEDVRSIIEDTLKDDEVDRLERQLEEMRSEFTSELRDAKRTSSEGIDDPEYLKTDRQMQFRENQMEVMNENLKELPTRMAAGVQKGLIPLVERLQEGGDGPNLWQPPEPQARQQPPEPRARQPRQQNQMESRTAPDGREPDPPAQQQQNQQQPVRETENEVQETENDANENNEYADEVYGKLGIGDGGGDGGDA